MRARRRGCCRPRIDKFVALAIAAVSRSRLNQALLSRAGLIEGAAQALPILRAPADTRWYVYSRYEFIGLLVRYASQDRFVALLLRDLRAYTSRTNESISNLLDAACALTSNELAPI